MSNAPRPHGSRIAVLATGIALSLAVVATPAALAQDGPDAPVIGFFDAVVAGDFAALPDLFCEEFADQAVALGMGDDLLPGVDVGQLLGAFGFEVEGLEINVLEQTDGMATVSVNAGLAMTVDPEGVAPLVELLLAASGEEVTEDMVDLMSTMMVSQFESQDTDISEEIMIEQGEDGQWRICDDIGIGGDSGGVDTNAGDDAAE